MHHTLTQRVRADEQDLRRLMEMSLRVFGLLVIALVVFLALYFFIASLEVPVTHTKLAASSVLPLPVHWATFG
jgi:preprotein translocase subunit SecY